MRCDVVAVGTELLLGHVIGADPEWAVQLGQGRRRQHRQRDRRRRGLQTFRYTTLGVFVDMGRNKAVASTLGSSGVASRHG